jgi:uncharacterized protein (DUF488 family)
MGLGPFFTIGHSTRSVDEFVGLLTEAGADAIADVRTVPRSRTNPQFNFDAFPPALAARAIAYRHFAALGGLRSRARGAAASPNPFWKNASFRNYADYAMTPEFRDGLAELRALGDRRTCAIMCAEAVWWRCHRRIIADYLLAEGQPVRHILGPGHIDPATMTRGALVQEDGTILYPPAEIADDP